MTRGELFAKIKELNIPKSNYSIHKGLLAQVNLDKYNDGNWCVFVLGDKVEYFDDDSFIYKEQAYDYFYKLLLREFG